jgi:Transposase DDE domain
MVGVFSLSTGALFDLAIASWSGKGTGEHTLLRQLMHVFTKGDIVIADAYYASFFLIAMLIQMGVDVVFPQHASRHSDFRTGKRLGKGDHLVEWIKPARPKWMSKAEHENFPNAITMRETKIVSNRPGFRGKSRVLVTTFINEKDVTPADLGELYSFRWFVELNLRSVKETMRMDILRCKTPEMVRKEIWAHILAYNLVRQTMLQSALIHQCNPREMSFKLALQTISAFRQAGILCESNQHYALFLQVIASRKTGQQKRASEPRMIKRRPKAFPRMQKPRAFYQKDEKAACLS